MRFWWPVLCCCLLLGCKKDPPLEVKKSLAPKELSLEGEYHAIACGPVTAVWSGSAEALKDLPQPASKTFGVESLRFKFADGTSKGFAPTGQVFFNDWRFEIFSTDCSAIALQVDHYGPYHLVKTEVLRGYLEGKVKPVVVQAPQEKDALVHADGKWLSGEQFEFSASCCGASKRFRTTLAEAGALHEVTP